MRTLAASLWSTSEAIPHSSGARVSRHSGGRRYDRRACVTPWTRKSNGTFAPASTTNHSFLGWPGSNLFARAEHAHAALAEALVTEVRKRAPHAVVPEALVGLDLAAFARAKLAPMVRGLFPRGEQQTVLDILARSVVFLTPDNIEQILRRARWLKTAWDLANLYLSSVHAELLSDVAPHILGLSEETSCYVSVEYFTDSGRFADFVVHDAAHGFHNCKRRTIGLPSTRRREWILDIDFAKRETFAYPCEAYSRILD